MLLRDQKENLATFSLRNLIRVSGVMVATLVLEASAEMRESSSLSLPTIDLLESRYKI